MYGSTYFNGTSGFLSIASDSRLALGRGAFTIEMWVYIPRLSLATTAVILDQRNGTSGSGVIQPLLQVTSASGFVWFVAGANRITSTAGLANLRAWTHLVIERYAGITTMYLDGVSVGSFTDMYDYPAGSINIGKANDGSSTNYFEGMISDLRIVVGRSVYNSSSGSTLVNSLLSYTQLQNVDNTALLTCNRSNQIVDTGPYNITLTNNGGVVPSNMNTITGGLYGDSWLGEGIVGDGSGYNSTTIEESYRGRWSGTRIGPDYNR